MSRHAVVMRKVLVRHEHRTTITTEARKPSAADLALMRFILGLAPDVPLTIETNATRSGHA